MKALSKSEIQEILKVLDREFPTLEVPLKHRSGFELLVAVILSAQCTDARVNTITPLLFPKNKPCTPRHILNLGFEKVREIIHPCGYHNQKAKAILGCAQELLGKELPSDLKKLTSLPGVGPKTAQVIQAQWFGMDAFPVDTHIHRICNRLGLANSGSNPNITERQVKAIVPKEYWSPLHLQMIFHGRKTCTARKPKCSNCPLRQICRWPEKN
jgi:endonuclease-3